MNAPAPPPIGPPRRHSAAVVRCANTRLAVPECSCLNCVERLIRAHAPALLARGVQPLS